MNEEEFIAHEEVGQQYAQYTLEFQYWHAVHIYYLNDIRNYIAVESEGSHRVQYQLVYNLEDHIFHAWEIKLFDCHLDSLLNFDSRLKLIKVVILDSHY